MRTVARVRAASAAAVLLAACDPAAVAPADAGADAAPIFLTEDELELARAMALPEGSPPPPDATNAFADDPSAAAFGQQLFFDARFSGPLTSADNSCVNERFVLGTAGQTGRVACAGCHVPGESAPHLVDTRSLNQQISLAADWVLRRTPTLLDIAQTHLYNWDGRHDTLHALVFTVIENPLEMNSGRLYVAGQIQRLYRTEYEAIFGAMPDLGGARFAIAADDLGCTPEGICRGAPGDGAEYDALSPEDQRAVTRVVINAGKAIAAYLRQLRCGESRFDRWLRGEDALSEEEQRGLSLFLGEGGCVRCHSGPYFSDHDFHNVGLEPEPVAVAFIDLDDPGAAQGIARLLEDPLSSTGEFSDGANPLRPDAVTDAHLGAFRTPILRCHARHPSFFHTGHVTALRDAVAHFVQGGDRYGFLGRSELADESGRPVELAIDDAGIDAVVAFLETLEGEGPSAELLRSPIDHEPAPLECP